MAYILTIDFPDSGEHEEEYDELWQALARVKQLQAMPWTQSGTPPMTLDDGLGYNIDIDTGLYCNRPAPDAIADAMAEDTVQRFPQHIGRSNRLPPIPDAEFCIASRPLKVDINEAFGKRMVALQIKSAISPDANVEAVREAMLQRSEFGLRKYGITTADSPLGIAGWLQHLQEELMDATVYVQCLKNDVEADNERLRKLLGEAYNAGACAQAKEQGFGILLPEPQDEYVNRVLAEQAKKK